jgi:hypothetical protein
MFSRICFSLNYFKKPPPVVGGGFFNEFDVLGVRAHRVNRHSRILLDHKPAGQAVRDVSDNSLNRHGKEYTPVTKTMQPSRKRSARQNKD